MKDVYPSSKTHMQEVERLAPVEQLQRKARKLKRLVGWWVLGTIVGVEVFALCCWALEGMLWLPYAASGLVMSYVLVCFGMGMTLLWDETGVQAVKLHDKRMVGTLLDMLGLAKLGMTVRTPLLQLLPLLHSEDAGLLTEAQRAHLNQVLIGRDVPLILATLKALEQIGDKKSLPFVQRLIKGEGEGAKSVQVREAAQQCSPLLQERIAQKAASQTLLRPTQAENMAEGTLLRAAYSSPPTEATELLRAGIADE